MFFGPPRILKFTPRDSQNQEVLLLMAKDSSIYIVQFREKPRILRTLLKTEDSIYLLLLVIDKFQEENVRITAQDMSHLQDKLGP